MEENKEKRGGNRPNSGVKPDPERGKLLKTSLAIFHDQREALAKLPGSEGENIRKAIDSYIALMGAA